MTSPSVRSLLATLLAAAVLLVCAGCRTQGLGAQADTTRPSHPASRSTATAGPSDSSGSSSPARPSGSAVPPAGDPYVHLAEALHRRGVEVWFETDLVAAWLAGPAKFQTTLDRLAQLATVPGVKGFKVADELGYHDGITSPEQGLAFLRAAHEGLAAAAPHAELLIDMVVPELGCTSPAGPVRVCVEQARATSPAASVPAVTEYLKTGWVDRLDLSTGLLDASTYAGMGQTLLGAQADAWREVQTLGWGKLTMLQARKALAAPGGWTGSPGEAQRDVALYVSTPHTFGAHAVDVWTWRQPYDGSTVSLLPPSLQANALWQSLAGIRDPNLHLFTHMTPSAMPTAAHAFARECDTAAHVFDAVFVAAGTG